MHIQVRSGTVKSRFSDEEPPVIATSAEYPAGSLSDVLRVLARNGFNLRGASGQHIELGGDFSFWVDKREGDKDHEASTMAARDVLVGEGYEALAYEVSARYLPDEEGALLAFIERLAGEGLLVHEISVGTPDSDGIPVQVFTVKAG